MSDLYCSVCFRYLGVTASLGTWGRYWCHYWTHERWFRLIFRTDR